jgi:hypothetical protein
MIKFKNCAISAVAGVIFPNIPMIVFATKFFQTSNVLIGHPRNVEALQLGVDDGDVPLVQLKGAIENASIQHTFFTGDLYFNNVRGLGIDISCQFDLLRAGGGAARILANGDEKASGIDIRATFLHVDNRGPAIVQASRNNSAQLLGSNGWRVKIICRDRNGIKITKGFINTDGCVFQSRDKNAGTLKGIIIDDGAQQVHIGPTTDFTTLQLNNHIAVEDNRTNSIGNLILDIEKTTNDPLSNVGVFTTVLSGKLDRKLRGGSCRVSYGLSARSNVTSPYRVKLSIGGVEMPMYKNHTALIASEFEVSCSKVLKLPSDTTSIQTATLQVWQETAGTPAVIRGGTSLGSSFIQIEEIC